jgi:hypothetical protein
MARYREFRSSAAPTKKARVLLRAFIAKVP